MLAQQSQSNYNNTPSNGNNMYIQQNPVIASPSVDSTRGGSLSGGSINGAPTSKIIAQNVEESLSDPQLAGHPSTWSIDQVAHWLRCCGFGTVVSSFIDNEISGAILLELNLNNLKELDITSFGKRFNIINAITSLKQLTKSNLDSKNSYGGLSNMSSMYSVGSPGGPNIPPRMTSAPINVPANGVNLPEPRASYDSRGDYLRDSRHKDLSDPRNAPLPPGPSHNARLYQQIHAQNLASSSQQPLQTLPQQQQFSDYDIQAGQPQNRSAANLARSDTLGSVMSGASIGDYGSPTLVDAPSLNGQRQSATSAFSSNPNLHRSNNPWDRHASRAPQPQMPSPVASQPRGALSTDFDNMGYGQQQSPQPQLPMDHYPRPMEVSRNAPGSPEVLRPDPYSNSMMYEQPTPKPRKFHNPDTTNRPQNGKADPSDKVVPLELIGRPDYAGWLKKRGDTYRTWKSRWFMLKGVTLYYMNSPKDSASKDYINLVGYKIIQDENIYAGKYCFKAVHEDLRNFYFYTDSESDMKGWLKALMKVTIGRDPTAPVISSSNIPTIPLHVARKLAPRPPSPSRRVNRNLGANGQPIHSQQLQKLQYDQGFQQQKQLLQQQMQQLQQSSQPQPRSSHQQQQLLDYDDHDSDGEGYHPNDYSNNHPGNIPQKNGDEKRIAEHPESPVLQSLSVDQQRHSFVHSDQRDGDDDPWRDEDGEGFGHQQKQQQQQQQQQQQELKYLRPDSELDSFRQPKDVSQPKIQEQEPLPINTRWTQEQYVEWINRHLPSTVEPVSDMTQSLRSGVVLVRLIEQLSGETVDKRVPNATYTLQMLENLLTAFKFMDRVGVSTDGYTVKDVFNGNEEKIAFMFEAIRARFPENTPSGPNPTGTNSNASASSVSTLHQQQQQLSASSSLSTLNASVAPASSLPPLPNGPSKGSPVPKMNGRASPAVMNNNSGRSPLIGNANTPRMQIQHIGDESEYEALYDEAARSTIS
ncbi:polar growth protein [Lobosporangium transversale]|nr:polar growth protein [Lobosporangium transversale]